MRIRDLPYDAQPREKALKNGFSSLSDGELLAIFINTGYRDVSAIDIANNLITKYEGLTNLVQLHKEQLVSVKGISEIKATKLMALFEVSKRMNREQRKDVELGKWNPQEFYERYRLDYLNLTKERLVLYLLDRDFQVKRFITIFEGNESGFDMKTDMIFKHTVLDNCNKIVLAHNHPSQNELPSQDDVMFTTSFMMDCSRFGITLVDHVIFTNNKFCSLIEGEQKKRKPKTTR